MLYTPDDVIAEKVGIGVETIRKWGKDWDEAREIETNKYVRDTLKGAGRAVTNVLVNLSFPMIQNSLVARANKMKADGKPLSMLEINMLVGVMDKLQNMFGLAISSETEDASAQNYVPLTIQEIRNFFVSDKFFDPDLLIPLKEGSNGITDTTRDIETSGTSVDDAEIET